MIIPRIRIPAIIFIPLLGLMECDCERMKSAIVQFKRITSTFNPVNMEYCDFFITPGSNGRSIELDTNLLTNISNELHIGVDFLMKGYAEDSYKQIFSYDFDVCRLWERLMQQTIARMWFKNLKKFSNIPTTCPVYQGLYYIRKMKVETRSVPVFIISGRYMVKVLIYIKRGPLKDLLTNSSLEVEVIKA